MNTEDAILALCAVALGQFFFLARRAYVPAFAFYCAAMIGAVTVALRLMLRAGGI